jgi:hypothetical protein
MFTTLNLIKQQRGENKIIMVMGVLKYASKWITTTKGRELKMENLCVIYMNVPKQTQNTKSHSRDNTKFLTLNFKHNPCKRLCVIQNVLKWTIIIRGERK